MCVSIAQIYRSEYLWSESNSIDYKESSKYFNVLKDTISVSTFTRHWQWIICVRHISILRQQFRETKAFQKWRTCVGTCGFDCLASSFHVSAIHCTVRFLECVNIGVFLWNYESRNKLNHESRMAKLNRGKERTYLQSMQAYWEAY